MNSQGPQPVKFSNEPCAICNGNTWILLFINSLNFANIKHCQPNRTILFTSHAKPALENWRYLHLLKGFGGSKKVLKLQKMGMISQNSRFGDILNIHVFLENLRYWQETCLFHFTDFRGIYRSNHNLIKITDALASGKSGITFCLWLQNESQLIIGNDQPIGVVGRHFCSRVFYFR